MRVRTKKKHKAGSKENVSAPYPPSLVSTDCPQGERRASRREERGEEDKTKEDDSSHYSSLVRRFVKEREKRERREKTASTRTSPPPLGQKGAHRGGERKRGEWRG